MKIFTILSIICFLFALRAQADTCSLNAAAIPRSGSGSSYPTGNGVSQIYDLSLANNGTCAINNIILLITLPAGASISNQWNIQLISGSQYTVTSFGGALQSGGSAVAGFIVFFPNTQTVPSGGVSASAATTTCNVCSVSSSATSASSTSSSSSAATSGATTSNPAITTVSATTASSSSSSSGPQCGAALVLTPRSGGSFPSGSGVSQIYDVVVTNSRSCPLNTIIVTLTIPAGASISSSWNLQLISGSQYSVTSFGDQLPSGNSVNVGFIVFFPSTQTVPSGGVSAVITATTCNLCPGATSSSSSVASSSSSSSSSSTATTASSSTTGSVPGCLATAVLTPRAGSSFQSGSGISQIYDVVVTNSGPCPIHEIILLITLPAGSSITSSWNLIANSANTYTVTSFGDQLPVHNSVNTGFVLFFPNTQTVPSTGVSASVAANVCNTC